MVFENKSGVAACAAGLLFQVIIFSSYEIFVTLCASCKKNGKKEVGLRNDRGAGLHLKSIRGHLYSFRRLLRSLTSLYCFL